MLILFSSMIRSAVASFRPNGAAHHEGTQTYLGRITMLCCKIRAGKSLNYPSLTKSCRGAPCKENLHQQRNRNVSYFNIFILLVLNKTTFNLKNSEEENTFMQISICTHFETVFLCFLSCDLTFFFSVVFKK